MMPVFGEAAVLLKTLRPKLRHSASSSQRQNYLLKQPEGLSILLRQCGTLSSATKATSQAVVLFPAELKWPEKTPFG